MEAGTVPEKVTISHRGARYEIGRGKRFFGIWAIGAPESDPVDRWPENRDGWEQAWTRFVALETPGTIRAVEPSHGRLTLPRPRLKLPGLKRRPTVPPGTGGSGSAVAVAGAGLLGFGVLLGLIGLFPGYIGSQSLASQADQLVPHVLYLAAWAASAVLIAVGGTRARIGALLATGVSAVTFGLFFADLGQVISGGASLLGAGLVLSLLGWLACAAGSALALVGMGVGRGAGSDRLGGPGRPRGADAGPLALLGLAAVGTAVSFVPSWDSFTLTQTATGATQTITAGYAFANPWPVIFGDVAVMVAIVAVAVLAALWRPPRHGGILLAGAIVPLVGQAISALVQVSEPATPAMFGISQAQASAAGLTITSGLTPAFWVYCVFVISLLISSAWLLTTPKYPAMPVAAQPPQPGPDQASQSASGETGDSGDDAQDDEQSTYA
jgi:ABC-type transport system involved in multi-copper enzyme maturation permease subunit